MKKTKKKNGVFSAKKAISRTAAALNPGLTVECIDRYEALFGGCKKIEAYSKEETVILTSSCRIRIKGEDITIAFSGDAKILLSGKLSSIEFI
ncbi:MAG: YabP/YqfC family sporulation protein [Eubacteriales bacterium]